MSCRNAEVNAVYRLLLSACAAATLACTAAPFEAARQAPVAPPAASSAQRPGQSAAPAAGPTASLPKRKDSVKFLVVGDTGTGDSRQRQVAEQIVEARQSFPFDFAIMLGDNLYGSEGPSAYVKKFEAPYKPLLDAGVKFYATLGNHDEPAQRFYEPFNMGGKRYYSFSKGGTTVLGIGETDVEFFVLDSTYVTPAQIDWLEGALEGSKAKWKIAYFHLPIYSSGEKHGSEEDLQLLIEPLFVEHGVDVVFAGHEHFYERLKPQKGIVYITQGAGAKLREGNIRSRSPLTAKGFDSDRSFTVVEIVEDHMFFETISRTGQVVDSGSIARRELTETSVADRR
jgi:predicted phosphodiesterase